MFFQSSDLSIRLKSETGVLPDTMTKFRKVSGGVTAAKGFRANAVRAGIKKAGLDLALILSEPVSRCAAVATTNRFCAAPVALNREHLAKGRQVRAVIVNSGNANACTGQRGLADARKTAELIAEQLGCKSVEVLVASTGVIGVHIPMDKVDAGIRDVCGLIAESSSSDRAVEGIMTTDTKPKSAALRFPLGGRTVTIGGMTKGSGMIAPNMATMLAFLTTDAEIPRIILRSMLGRVVRRTFNRITVDSDTSTNDTLVLMANGASGATLHSAEGKDAEIFEQALEEICSDLATQIAADGEGATKLVRVLCEGARTEREAERVARTVADSPLVKTAMFGNDANWGRIVAALGRSGTRFDPAKVDVYLGRVRVVRDGGRANYSEEKATAAISGKEVAIRIVLREGTLSAEVKTCDLSYDYVRINAAYRT